MRGRPLWLLTKRPANLDVTEDRLRESWIGVTQVGKIVEGALRRVWCLIGLRLRLRSWVSRRHRLQRLTACIGLRLCWLGLLGGLRVSNLRLGNLRLGNLRLRLFRLGVLSLGISLLGRGLKSWLAGCGLHWGRGLLGLSLSGIWRLRGGCRLRPSARHRCKRRHLRKRRPAVSEDRRLSNIWLTWPARSLNHRRYLTLLGIRRT